MRRYESVVVISAEIGETRIKEETAKIQAFLESHGAKEVKVDRWGAKEVGLRMRKPLMGHYTCFAYSTENNALQDSLVGMLRIMDSVLKFQTFKISDKVRKFKGYVRKKTDDSAADDVGDAESASF